MQVVIFSTWVVLYLFLYLKKKKEKKHSMISDEALPENIFY